MDAFRLDLRYALRSLLRSPGFTAVAALTLALGIGANTAIFSVVYSVLLRPLAYAEPEELVSIRASLAGRGVHDLRASQPEYHDYLREVPSLEDLAAIWPVHVNLTGLGDPLRVQGAGVSHNYFRLLGVAPALGRDFTPEDDGGRVGYVAIISHDLWQRQFGGDRAIIGKAVQLDDDPITIVGVTPRGFRHVLESGVSPMQVWFPIALDNPDPNFVNDRGQRVFDLIGRLRADRTVDDARSELDLLTARLAERYPSEYPPASAWSPAVQPLAEQVTGEVRPALLVLLGPVGFVLLIGCANVANLLLARAASREREIAVRTALGGSQGRLIRQLLTESMVLAVAGGLLGLLLAAWGASALGQVAAQYLPRAAEIELSLPVLGFTAFLILLTGLGFGLIPALQASRPDLQGVLKEAARGSSGAPRARMRAALVVAEVALALMLLAGAGLLLRSFQRLMAVEHGFDPERLLALQVWLPWPNQPEQGRYFTREQRLAFYDRALGLVRRVNGVRDAALVSRLPLRGSNSIGFTIEGRPPAAGEATPGGEFRVVSPGFFRTMGIPILRGEGFPETADSASARTAVVNRALADRYWPGESPIGRRIRLFDDEGPWVTITGVVGDVRQIGLGEPARAEVYVSYRAFPGQEAAMVVRTAGDPERLAAAVTGAIREADPEQPVFGVMSMERLIDNAGAERRVSLLLLLLFAGIALLLSALGIYGVMSYTTSQRQHEIGIRMALGARGPDVLRLVVGQGMRLVAVGLGLGLVGAWLLSRFLDSQLFGVTRQDPVTYISVSVLLAVVALSASWLPARRATRVDPMLSLRSE